MTGKIKMFASLNKQIKRQQWESTKEKRGDIFSYPFIIFKMPVEGKVIFIICHRQLQSCLEIELRQIKLKVNYWFVLTNNRSRNTEIAAFVNYVLLWRNFHFPLVPVLDSLPLSVSSETGTRVINPNLLQPFQA